MFNSKRNIRAGWMAAACAAAGMMLGGCDASVDPNHAARQATVEAARRTAAAGDTKTTNELLALVASGTTTIPSGNLGQYLQKPGAQKDLAAAAGDLTKAISADLRPGVKSAVESQLGATQLELSIAGFVDLQNDIIDLTQQAMALQNVSQQAVDAGSQADTLEAGAAKSADGVKQLKEAADKATAEVNTRQAALSAAQEKIKGIQDQISSKDNDARKIYSDTDTAFRAADAQKGAAAIAAGKKAMDDRKAADQLMAEIGNLAPDLLQAQGELSLAQVSLSAAQNLARASTSAYESSMAATDKNNQLAKDLRAAAAKIVNDPDGVKARVTAYIDAYSKLDAKIKQASNAASQAAASYTSASTDYRAAIEDAKKVIEDKNLDGADPISKFAKDARMTAILLWSQSAASQQGGRVSLAAADAADLAGLSLTLAGKAYAAAKIGEAPKAPANSHRDEATALFTKAVDTASNANRTAAPAGTDLDRIKWIGYQLEASANEGLYRSGNKADALAAAKAAQGKAVQSNPALQSQFAWLDQAK